MFLFSRRLMFLPLLGASVLVPYLASNGSRLLERFSIGSSGPTQAELALTTAEGRDVMAAKLAEEPGAILFPSPIPLEGLAAIQLEEVFRFDITREWVYARWPRKSTSLASADLFGIRVPLVTGTAVDDLAGSLTYYFNSEGRVQHIAFRGRTGDTGRLVRLVAGRFGLRPQSPKVPGEQLYQFRWNGRPQSELRTRPAAVLWNSSPHSSFEVELRLERPGSNRFLDQG